MDVLSTTSVTTATSAATTANAAVNSDYQTFLKMLTTQLQHQDPLSPMESSEFAVQIATFTGVEQQTVTNQLLESLAGKLDAMALSDLSGWLGAEALVAGPAYLDGDAVEIVATPAEGATETVLVTTDANGTIVNREVITATGAAQDWQPSDITGAALASGTYTLTLESYSGETLLGTSGVGVYSTITEAKSGTEGTVLVMEGGVEVAASAVQSLRR